MECLFCNIINGETPSKKIYESDEVIAFLDIYPKTFGHVLVVPKRHSNNLLEMNYDNNVLKEISIVTNILKDKLNCDGINVENNNGSIAGQIIFHTHFHLLPRFEDNKYDKEDIDLAYNMINV
ncbi:MAG: HIT family protein [Mycoplasmatales bacterium]